MIKMYLTLALVLNTVWTMVFGTNSTTLHACKVAERRSVGLFYDYDRTAPAVDLAVQYVNEIILSSINFYLTYTYVDIGPNYSSASHALSYFMQKAWNMHGNNLNCDVFIGPGSHFTKKAKAQCLLLNSCFDSFLISSITISRKVF